MSSVTLMALTKDINQILRDATKLRIYGNEVKEGFQRPCFFVQVLPVQDQIESANLERRLITVIIHYFSEHGTDPENLTMADTLRQTFGMIISAGGRKLTRGEARTDTVDGVLQFKFDLSFYDEPAGAGTKEPYDLMKVLKTKWR